MAFDPEKFALVIGDLTGSVVRVFAYRSPDTLDAISAVGYFAGVSEYGAQVGDSVVAVLEDGSSVTTGGFSAISATGDGTFEADPGDAGRDYLSRPAAVAAAPGMSPAVGAHLRAGGHTYVYDGASTEILDLPGWRPDGLYTPQHFGKPPGIKERTGERVYGHTLADRYDTLAEAQAVFPKATALTETIDRHAAQRMVDAKRATSTLIGSNPLLPWQQNTKRIAFHFPGDEYVFDKSLDLTGIRAGVGMWELTGDRAVIYSQAVGETTFDLLNSNRCRMRGFTILGELLRDEGCPRSGILVGRGSSGLSSGEHDIRDVEFAGVFTVGFIHNYASEVNKFDVIGTNHLDPRQTLIDLDDLTGDPAAGETVSWSGGTGTVVSENGSYAIIQVDSGSTALTDGVAVTASGGATWSAGNPYAMPDGEWKDGRSFSVVFDSDNRFGTGSVHTENRAQDTLGSFIDNMLEGQIVHSGRGNPVYVGCGTRNLRIPAYLASTGDDDGAAGIVVNANTTNSLVSFYADVLIESDGGDTSADTGIDYGILFATDGTYSTISCFEGHFRQVIANPAIGSMHAETAITSVSLYGWHLAIGNLGAGPTTRRMWASDSASKFRFSGTVMFTDPGSSGADYLNIADLNTYCSSYSRVTDIEDANALRATNSGYPISDATGYAFSNSVRVQAVGGVSNFIAQDADAETGRVRFNGSNVQFDPDGDGTRYVMQDDAYYWGGGTGTVTSGLDAKRWSVVYAENLELRPGSTRTPSSNGDLTVAATDNTTLTFSLKGSDGTVRSGTISLS